MDIEALEKQELKKKGRLVALLFIMAIALALVFAYWMGAFGFGSTRAFYVDYNFAGGLERGSTVRLAGIKVGRVASIDFFKSEEGTPAQTGAVAVDPSEAPQLRLKIEVNKHAFKQLTSDSKFFINLAGLIGERYVEVVPGTGTPIEGGHAYRGVDPPRIDQLFSQGYGIFGDLRAFFQENRGDLKDIFATLNSLSKNLSDILKSVSPEQKRQISQLLSNLSAASIDIKDFFGNLNSAAAYAEKNGAKDSWQNFIALLAKGNNIKVDDLRRLMLEDGVRVRFGKNEVPKVDGRDSE